MAIKPNKVKLRSRIKAKGTLTAVGMLLVGFVGGWEGKRNNAYLDIVGVPTVCYGETRGVKLGDRYTDEECKAMLGDGLDEFAAGVNKCLTDPSKVPDKTYAAFVSLAYNIGQGAFCRSTVARKANANDFIGACNAIPAWNKAGGKVVKGLVNRRKEEQKLCLEGARGI